MVVPDNGLTAYPSSSYAQVMQVLMLYKWCTNANSLQLWQTKTSTSSTLTVRVTDQTSYSEIKKMRFHALVSKFNLHTPRAGLLELTAISTLTNTAAIDDTQGVLCLPWWSTISLPQQKKDRLVLIKCKL